VEINGGGILVGSIFAPTSGNSFGVIPTLIHGEEINNNGGHNSCHEDVQTSPPSQIIEPLTNPEDSLGSPIVPTSTLEHGENQLSIEPYLEND
jgi:hypothetical protein